MNQIKTSKTESFSLGNDIDFHYLKSMDTGLVWKYF